MLFVFSGELLKRFGNRQLLIMLIVFEYVAISGLIIAPSLLIIGLSFFLHTSVTLLIYYSLDISLEEVSADSSTGEIRGTFLTISNLAIAIAPIIVASFALGTELIPVYAAALILLWPLVLIAFFGIKKGVPTNYEKHSISLPFGDIKRAINVWRVTKARFVLEFFYAIMVIYVPIYLRTSIGFSWAEIGVMFSIMLLPFIIFGWPVGFVADKFLGEKEIMTLGYFILGTSVLAMPFIGSKLIIWTIVLFISRIGACFVETTTESYFFKHIDSRDTGFISIFRISRPAAVIIAAAVGTLSLELLSFNKVFFVLAFVIFIGMRNSVKLKDTL
jgi:MFS family permease